METLSITDVVMALLGDMPDEILEDVELAIQRELSRRLRAWWAAQPKEKRSDYHRIFGEEDT